VVLGHFFGLFPSVAIATPKMPGVVVIKGPATALNKKKWALDPGFVDFGRFQLIVVPGWCQVVYRHVRMAQV
jgi:hypothetical protein